MTQSVRKARGYKITIRNCCDCGRFIRVNWHAMYRLKGHIQSPPGVMRDMRLARLSGPCHVSTQILTRMGGNTSYQHNPLRLGSSIHPLPTYTVPFPAHFNLSPRPLEALIPPHRGARPPGPQISSPATTRPVTTIPIYGQLEGVP